MSKIAYAKHPLAKSDAEKLRADGFKIIDIRHKPDVLGEDDVIFPAPVKRKAKKKAE